jgi:hypothetical protein
MDTILIIDEFEENNNKIIVQENFIAKDNFSFEKYIFENKEECSRYDNTPSSDFILNFKNENENGFKEEFKVDLQSSYNSQDNYIEKKTSENYETSNKSKISNYSTNSNSEKR